MIWGPYLKKPAIARENQGSSPPGDNHFGGSHHFWFLGLLPQFPSEVTDFQHLKWQLFKAMPEDFSPNLWHSQGFGSESKHIFPPQTVHQKYCGGFKGVHQKRFPPTNWATFPPLLIPPAVIPADVSFWGWLRGVHQKWPMTNSKCRGSNPSVVGPLGFVIKWCPTMPYIQTARCKCGQTPIDIS